MHAPSRGLGCQWVWAAPGGACHSANGDGPQNESGTYLDPIAGGARAPLFGPGLRVPAGTWGQRLLPQVATAKGWPEQAGQGLGGPPRDLTANPAPLRWGIAARDHVVQKAEVTPLPGGRC